MQDISDCLDDAQDALSDLLSCLEHIMQLHPEMMADLQKVREPAEIAKQKVTAAYYTTMTSATVPVVSDVALNNTGDAEDLIDSVINDLQSQYDISSTDLDYAFATPEPEPEYDFGGMAPEAFADMFEDAPVAPIVSSRPARSAQPQVSYAAGGDPFMNATPTDFTEATLGDSNADFGTLVGAYSRDVGDFSDIRPMGQPELVMPATPMQQQAPGMSPFDSAMAQIRGNTVTSADVFNPAQQEVTRVLDLPIDAVPFNVSTLSLVKDGEESSMFVACADDKIGEWDIATLISESDIAGSDFDVKEFSLEGPLGPEQSDCELSWSAKDSTVRSTVSMAHGKGALTEAASARGYSPDIITLSYSEDSIVERVNAISPKEALSFIPLMEVTKMSITIEFLGTDYTMYFYSDYSAFEVAWTQKPNMNPGDLVGLMQFLAVSLKVYAVSKLDMEHTFRKPERWTTRAGDYADNKNLYTINKTKKRIRNEEFDIGGIRVRGGKVMLLPFES